MALLRQLTTGMSCGGRRRHSPLLLFLLPVGTFVWSSSASAQVITCTVSAGQTTCVNRKEERPRALAATQITAKRSRGGLRKGGLASDTEKHVLGTARRHAVDPALVRAVIQVESAWNPRAVSPKGAMGLMQLMPDTAARFGVEDPFDPKANVEGGVRYLRFLLNLFEGNARLALAAYNAGEGVVGLKGGVPPYAETSDFLARVEKLYGELEGERSPRIDRAAVGAGVIYSNVRQGGNWASGK